MHSFEARLWDARIARWTSMDPVENFYSPYAGMHNNPLSQVDPDGRNPILVGILAVGIFGGVVNASRNYEEGVGFMDIVGNFAVGFAAGAASTALVIAATPAVVGAFGPGFFGGATLGALGGGVSGFTLGAGNTWMDGGDFLDGLSNGLQSAAVGAVSGGVTGGVLAGAGAVLQGKNFFWGVARLPPVTNITLKTAKVGSIDSGGGNAQLRPSTVQPTVQPQQKTLTLKTSGLPDGMKLAAKTSTSLVDDVVVHGNSLASKRPTWGYKLYSQDGTFLKNGITSKLVPEARYTRAFMSDKYMVPFKQFPNRLGAYQWEFGQNQILRGPLNLNMH